MLNPEDIERGARHVKIVGRGGKILAEDGQLIPDFTEVSGGLRIRVLKNQLGGEAEVEVSTEMDRRLHKLSFGAIPSSVTVRMNKGGSYGDGHSVVNSAFKAL